MSYNASGQKWGDTELGTPSGVIEWSMDLSGGLQFNTSLYDLSDFEAALSDAFDAWEEVAAIDFTFVNSGGSDMDIVVGAMLPDYPESVVAYASWSGGATITSGGVVFDEEEYWSPNGGGGGINFYAVALHEIGHVLGLGHVDDTSEIMNDYISRSSLGDGDIDGVRYLYGTGTTEEDPEDEPSDDPVVEEDSSSDGGSGGGGAIAAVLGLLALVMGAVFGFGGGAALAVAAARSGSDGSDDAEEEDDVLLSDLIPVTGDMETHGAYVSEEDWLASEHDDHEDELLVV